MTQVRKWLGLWRQKWLVSKGILQLRLMDVLNRMMAEVVLVNQGCQAVRSLGDDPFPQTVGSLSRGDSESLQRGSSTNGCFELKLEESQCQAGWEFGGFLLWDRPFCYSSLHTVRPPPPNQAQ